MTDPQDIDYHKILYTIADKCPAKSEKNPRCVVALQVYEARACKTISQYIMAATNASRIYTISQYANHINAAGKFSINL
jgi:hypothetical protein